MNENDVDETTRLMSDEPQPQSYDEESPPRPRRHRRQQETEQNTHTVSLYGEKPAKLLNNFLSGFIDVFWGLSLFVNWCVVTFMPILKHIRKTRAFHFRWIPVKCWSG